MIFTLLRYLSSVHSTLFYTIVIFYHIASLIPVTFSFTFLFYSPEISLIQDLLLVSLFSI